MTPYPFEDNRLYHAFRMPRRTVQAVLDAADHDDNLIANTLNVSEKGACVVLTSEVPAGRTVRLVVDDRNQPRQFCLPGVVAWCERVGAQWVASVRFDDHPGFASSN